MRKKRGFTLVELIVVIAIIGILAAVLIPTFSGAFTSANLAADRGDASNMTRILRTAYVAGIPDNIEAPEIRAAVNAEGEFSFVPRTASDGYSLWYDKAGQEIIVAKASDLSVTAGAAGHNAPSLEEVVSGYLMVDAGGNRVADLLASFRNLLSLDEYNTLKTGAEALKEDLPAGFTAEQIDDLVYHLVGENNANNFSPEHNLYINDFGSFTTARGGVVTRMIFSDGITMISAVSATVTAVRNDIVVPSSVSFVEEGAFAAIQQTEDGNQTIETNLIFRDADIKVESDKVFSDYLLEKNSGLSGLPKMRTDPVGEVRFEITFDQPTAGKGDEWSIETMPNEGADGQPIIAYTLKTEAGTTQYRPFRLTINPQVVGTKDGQTYISDTWRFRYQNLPDGSVAVQVKLFDSEGVVGEDTVIYRVPETLDLQFKDSTLRFAELTSALSFAEKTGQKVTYTLKVGETSYTFYKGIVQDLQNLSGLSQEPADSVTLAWLKEQGYIDNTNADNTYALTSDGKTLQAALSMSGMFGEFNFGTEKDAKSMSDIAFLLGTDGWTAWLDSTDGSGRAELSYQNGTWKNGSETVPEENLSLIYFERVSEREGTSSGGAGSGKQTTTVSGKLTTTTTSTNPSTITYTLRLATEADKAQYGESLKAGTLIMLSQESGTSQTITNVQVDVDEDGTPETELGFTRVNFIEYHTFNYFLATVYGVEDKWFGSGNDLTLEVKVGNDVVIRQTLNNAKPESESTISQTIANQENTSYQYEFSYRSTYAPGTPSPILEMGKMKVTFAGLKNPYEVSLYTKAEYESHKNDPGYDYFHGKNKEENVTVGGNGDNEITEENVTGGGNGDYEITGFNAQQETTEFQTATLTWHINFANLKYKFAEKSDAYNAFNNILATEAMTNRADYTIQYQIRTITPEPFTLSYLNGRQVGQAGDSENNPIVLAKGEQLVDSSQTYGVVERAGTIYYHTTVRPISTETVKVLEITGWPEADVKKGTLTVRYYPDGVGNSLYAESTLHYVVAEAEEEKRLEGTMAQINGREVAEGQIFRLTEGEGISLTNNTRMYYANGGSAVSVYFNSANADYGAGSNRQKLIVEYSTDGGSNWTELTEITKTDKTYTSGTPLNRPGENYNGGAEQLLNLSTVLKAGTTTGKLRFTYVIRVNQTGGSYGTSLEETVAFRDEVDFEIVPKSSVNHLAMRLDYNIADPDQAGNNVLTVKAGTKISRLNAAYGSYLQFINAQGTAQTCYLYAKAPYSTTTYKPNDYLVNVKVGDKELGSEADSAYEITLADNGKTLTYTVNYYGVTYTASATLRVVSDRPVRLMSLNGIRYFDGLVYSFAQGDTLITGSPTQIYYSYNGSYEAGFSLPATESETNYMKFFLSTDTSWSADDDEWERGKTFETAWNSWDVQGKKEGTQYYLIIRAMSSNTLFEDIAVPFTYSTNNQTVKAQVYSINARNVTTYGVFEVLHNEGLVGWSNYVGISLVNDDGTTSVKYYSEAEAKNFKVFVKYDKPETSASGDSGDWYDWKEIEVARTSSARSFAFDAALGTTGHFRILYSPAGFAETGSGGITVGDQTAQTYYPNGTVYDAEAPFRVSGMRVTNINNRSYGYQPDNGAKSKLTETNGKKTLTTTLTQPFLFYEGESFNPYALNLYIGCHNTSRKTNAEGYYLGVNSTTNKWSFQKLYDLTIQVVTRSQTTEVPAGESVSMSGSGILRLRFTAPGVGSEENSNYYSKEEITLVLEIPYQTSGPSEQTKTYTYYAGVGADGQPTGDSAPVSGILARIYRINNRQTDNTESVTFYNGEQIALHESYSATAMSIYAPDGRRRDLYSAATNGLNPYYGMIGRNYGTDEMNYVSDSYGRLGYNEYWLIKVTTPGEGQTADTAFRKLGLDPNYVGASAAELIRANYLDHVFKTGESGVLVWVRVQYGITYVAEIAYIVEAAEPLNGQDWENWSKEGIADLTWDKQDTNLNEMLVIEQSMKVTWFAEADSGNTAKPEEGTYAELITRKIPFKFTLHTFEDSNSGDNSTPQKAYVLREWSSDIHSRTVADKACYVALYDNGLITKISDDMRENGVSVTLVYVNRDTGEVVKTNENLNYAQLSLEKVSSGMIRGDSYTVNTDPWAQKEGETDPPSYTVKVLKTPAIKSDAQVGVISKINKVTYNFNAGDFYIIREEGKTEDEVVSVSSDSAVKVLTRNGYYTNVSFTEKFRYFVKGTKAGGTTDENYKELTVSDGKLDLSGYQSGTLKVVLYYNNITYVAERNFLMAKPATFVPASINSRSLTSDGTGIPVFKTVKGEEITAFSGTLTTHLKTSNVSQSSYWSYEFYPAESKESGWKPDSEGYAVDIKDWSVPESGYLVMNYSNNGIVAVATVYFQVDSGFKNVLNPEWIRLSLRSAANAAESPRTVKPDGGGYGIKDANGNEVNNLLVLSAEDGIMATSSTYVRLTRPDGKTLSVQATEDNLKNGKLRLYLKGKNIQGDDGDEKGRKKLTVADLLAADTAGKALLEPTLEATYTENGKEQILCGKAAAAYYSKYPETNSQITDEKGGSWTEGEARVEITRKAEVKEDGSCTMTVTKETYQPGEEKPSATEKVVYNVRYYAVTLIVEYEEYGITYSGEWQLIVLA